MTALGVRNNAVILSGEQMVSIGSQRRITILTRSRAKSIMRPKQNQSVASGGAVAE